MRNSKTFCSGELMSLRLVSLKQDVPPEKTGSASGGLTENQPAGGPCRSFLIS